jgi:hypothetical protein
LVSELREDLLLCSSYLPLGVPNELFLQALNEFSGAVAGEQRRRSSHVNYTPAKREQVFWHRCRGEIRLLQGESLTHNLLLCFCFALFLFLLAPFYQKYKKISFLYSFFYLLAFSFARMGTPEKTKLCDFTRTKNNDCICTPIAPPAPETKFYEIKSALLNLVMKEQFSGASSDDAAAHLNNFVELCEMQKYKDVDGKIIKFKLFPFSLRIGCYLCLEIVLILGISARILLLENIILLLRL